VTDEQSQIRQNVIMFAKIFASLFFASAAVGVLFLLFFEESVKSGDRWKLAALATFYGSIATLAWRQGMALNVNARRESTNTPPHLAAQTQLSEAQTLGSSQGNPLSRRLPVAQLLVATAAFFLGKPGARYSLGEVALYFGIYCLTALLLTGIIFAALASWIPTSGTELGWAMLAVLLLEIGGLWLLLSRHGRVEPRPEYSDGILLLTQVFFVVMAVTMNRSTPSVRGEGELFILFIDLVFFLCHMSYFLLAWGMGVRLPLRIYLQFLAGMGLAVWWAMRHSS